MSELRSTSEIIDALGGNQAVSELTGINNSGAVSNWRAQAAFPAWTYLSITRALEQTGKSAPDALWAMNPPRKRHAEASA